MITGYNTDIKHQSRVFHIQTEDNGLENPSIVTLIYVGGEILASKKTSYADKLPVDEKQISEMMETQHRRMILAIKKGVFDGPEIPKDPLAGLDDSGAAAPMISTTAVPRATGPVKEHSATSHLDPSVVGSGSRGSTQFSPPDQTAKDVPPPSVARKQKPDKKPQPKKTASIPISDRTLDQVIIDYLANESMSDHLELSFGGTVDICAGDSVELRILTKTAVSKEAIVGAEVVVKIISTVEKPIVAFKGKTTGDGSCLARFNVPKIAEGNAAVIVTASSPHGNDELKQLIKKAR